MCSGFFIIFDFIFNDFFWVMMFFVGVLVFLMLIIVVVLLFFFCFKKIFVFYFCGIMELILGEFWVLFMFFWLIFGWYLNSDLYFEIGFFCGGRFKFVLIIVINIRRVEILMKNVVVWKELLRMELKVVKDLLYM